jgi:hypothetical protein
MAIKRWFARELTLSRLSPPESLLRLAGLDREVEVPMDRVWG